MAAGLNTYTHVPGGAELVLRHVQGGEGLALLWWEHKQSWSLHSVDAWGGLVNGRYDIAERERAVELYAERVREAVSHM